MLRFFLRPACTRTYVGTLFIYLYCFAARALHEDDPLGLFTAEEDDDDDGDSEMMGKDHYHTSLIEAKEREDGKDGGSNGATLSAATAAAAAAAAVCTNNDDKRRESDDDVASRPTTPADQWDPVTGRRTLPEHVKNMLSAIKVTRFDEVINNSRTSSGV